jgi:hypothetical protein
MESIIHDSVNDDFQEEVNRLLHEGALGEYEAKLHQALMSEEAPFTYVFDYGIEQLHERGRPNAPLATYWLICSELAGLSRETSSFALDVMVFCENRSDFPTCFYSVEQVKEHYVPVRFSLLAGNY